MRSIILILILASTILNAQFEENVYYSLSGTIAGNDVSMTLIRTGNDIWGNYHFEKNAEDLVLIGTYMYPQIELNESLDCKSTVYATMNLNFIKKDSIYGEWKAENGKKQNVGLSYRAMFLNNYNPEESDTLKLLYSNTENLRFKALGEIYEEYFKIRNNRNQHDSVTIRTRIINKIRFVAHNSEQIEVDFRRNDSVKSESVFFEPWSIVPIIAHVDEEFKNYIFYISGVSNFNALGQCGSAGEYFLLHLQFNKRDEVIQNEIYQIEGCRKNQMWYEIFEIIDNNFIVKVKKIYIDKDTDLPIEDLIFINYDIDDPQRGLMLFDNSFKQNNKIKQNIRFIRGNFEYIEVDVKLHP
jgi:hypothetical protein